MLRRIQLLEDFAGENTDMTVLERQRAMLQRSHQQQPNYATEINPIEFGLMPEQFQTFVNGDQSMLLELLKIDRCFDNTLPNFGNSMIVPSEMDRRSFPGNSRSSVSGETAAATTMREGRDRELSHKVGMESMTEGKKLKKRKAEFDVEEDCLGNNIEGKASEVQSEVTVDTSMEISKASKAQKPDYIHVRARRGQATDSHSLAERARREKISKKMKCLQDLVPGCNKVTGKAGMLDEIINYVQSLQRQVEFLSMKLAVSNPAREDLSIFPAYVANFPTAAANPEFAYSGSEMLMIPTQTEAQRKVTSSISIPESYIHQVQNLPTWEANLLNSYNGSFH